MQTAARFVCFPHQMHEIFFKIFKRQDRNRKDCLLRQPGKIDAYPGRYACCFADKIFTFEKGGLCGMTDVFHFTCIQYFCAVIQFPFYLFQKPRIFLNGRGATVIELPDIRGL